jgi:hypothetical protein
VANQKTLYMETTTIPANRTIGDITARLVEAGARAIRTEYGEGGKPVALCWSMMIHQMPVFFQMPAKIEPLFKYLRQRRRGYMGAKDLARLQEQAERIAWRQLLRWVEVQLSLIEIGMVEYAQVFLPYVQENEGSTRTVWDVFREQRFKAIEAPKPQ